MSKLRIACSVIGVTMLLTLVIFQFMKPVSMIDGWENVNVEMANTLHQQSASQEKSDDLDQTQAVAKTETETEIETKMETTTTNVNDHLVVAPKQPMNVMINLNLGTLEQLDILPGIGPSKAKAIIEYRTKFGDFHTLEQIMEVKGIGPKLFEKMKDKITIATQ